MILLLGCPSDDQDHVSRLATGRIMGQYLPCARANAANSGTLYSFMIIHVLVIAKTCQKKAHKISASDLITAISLFRNKHNNR